MIFKRKKEKIDALVMAAGYGTRMEPLTIAVPKPMVYIANKPAMLLNLELLKRNGIDSAACNIHYHPEQIENFFDDGEEFGFSLSYSYEENLMGTAGGVRKMGREVLNIDNTFVVLSSDALTDINLKKIIKFHKDNKAVATIALSPVEDVTQFGVVIVDPKTNQITAFQEKPKQEEALSNLVNTGIYVFDPEILDMIPEGKFYDFGKELFPMLIEKGKKFVGYQTNEFWSDVGGLDAYLKANMDVLSGEVKLDIYEKKIATSTWVGKNTRIADSVHFKGGVIVGDRSIIEDDVELENVVVGNRVIISKGSKLKNCVIWPDTIILSAVEMENSVLGSWCYVGKEVKIESSVIANRCRVGAKIKVPANTRMNPGSDLL